MPIPKKKIVLIETIPTTYIDSEWVSTFEKAQQIVLPVYCLKDIDNRALRKFIKVETARWRIILHWVVKKKWCSKLKIPDSRKIAKSFEATGEHFKQVLELCIQLHPVSKYGHLYSNARNWFSQIINEVRTAEILAFVERNRTGNEGEAQIAKETCSNISGSLRGCEPKNPFCSEAEPHIWRLIESAIEMADKSDLFDKTYWKDFKKSLADINKKRKEGGSLTLIENDDGGLSACLGQGRGKITYW